ncbi:hypothetical protein BC937DRAFT_95232 [Endogone sp. FLAS-F59071]|nr:hypothetical protein BC937DRAFT_95232 [Endogone sp. FLAS-F59071]|eukprot:RUS13498.1 hypothetical protein BC937DRAFT_95232 [Endogone sp. FLAS-F59071]
MARRAFFRFFHFSFIKFNPDPVVVRRCYLDEGTLWEGSGSFDFDTANYTGVSVLLEGGLSNGHVSILRTNDPAVTTGTIHLSVYSLNVDLSTLSINQTSLSGVYHHTLVTPGKFYWGQCLVARWTIVLPYAWDNATKFVASVGNSAIEVAQVVEDLEFDSAELQTTNSGVDIGGLSAGAITIQSTNGAIRGRVSPGKNLVVSTSNAGIELESLRGGTEWIVVHTTNGHIVGTYVAVEGVALATTNAPIEARAEAGVLDLAATNAHILGEYHADMVASLWTSNAPVEAEVEAGDITIKTSNARIAGRFLAKRRIDISTSNAPIDITEGNGEEVLLRTSNARIAGEFVVGKRFDAQTSNDPIDVRVGLKEEAQAPEVKATTSYGRTQVILSDTFSGRFDVSTTYGRATVQNCANSAEDCDQTDIVFEKNARTSKSGTKGSEGQGLVFLRSRSGDARLFFD